MAELQLRVTVVSGFFFRAELELPEPQQGINAVLVFCRVEPELVEQQQRVTVVLGFCREELD